MGPTELAGRLLVGFALQVTEHKGSAIFLGQLAQLGVQCRAQIHLDHTAVWFLTGDGLALMRLTPGRLRLGAQADAVSHRVEPIGQGTVGS
jgi:hypothetical protein